MGQVYQNKDLESTVFGYFFRIALAIIASGYALYMRIEEFYRRGLVKRPLGHVGGRRISQ